MTNLLKRFAKDESGATAVEYGLVAAGISVAIIAVMQGLGSKLNTTRQSAFQKALGPQPPRHLTNVLQVRARRQLPPAVAR